MAEDLGDADDRKIFRVDDGIAAGGAHAIPANAEESSETVWQSRGNVWGQPPRLSSGAKLRSLSHGTSLQSLNKLRPIHFPGSLAR